MEQLEQITDIFKRGISVKDRSFHLKTYKACFVGTQAVDFLCWYQEINREEAVELGQAMMDAGVFEHVTAEHPFQDDQLFYRFAEDKSKILADRHNSRTRGFLR